MLKTIYLNIQNLLNFYLVSDFSFLINLIRHFQHKLMQKKLKIVLASVKRAPTSLFETFGHVLWWVFRFYSEKTSERRDQGWTKETTGNGLRANLHLHEPFSRWVTWARGAVWYVYETVEQEV